MNEVMAFSETQGEEPKFTGVESHFLHVKLLESNAGPLWQSQRMQKWWMGLKIS